MSQMQTSPAAAVVNRHLGPTDLEAVGALHAHVFGPGRFARTAYRVREGMPPISPFCSGAFLGDRLIASLRLSAISIGGTVPHLLLGPLAVAPEFSGQGYGRALVTECLASAQATRIGLVVLVGDRSYYDRFAFLPVPPGQITFPGPVNPARILAFEATPGALGQTRGAIVAAHPTPSR